ncbi:MAG: hypothetical protein ABWY06_24325 [Pseudomonas sp.]|uniref:hypothetical protein n=1 Tax=Pseudomonas sp. TaxID=306 RepID=UPI00339117E2
MSARVMCEGEWSGGELRCVESGDWTPGRAKAALERLDGRRRTQVQFSVGAGRCMMVGGGANRFSVIMSVDVDRALHTRVDPAKSDARGEDLRIGGQLDCFPQSQNVSKDMALAAIEHFYAEGEAAPGLTWLRS